MTTQTLAAYDEIPYPPVAHFHTRPDRMQALGLLHGLEPADPGTSRILELACGPGTNLISLAGLLPGARFVGVDLSEVQIREARRVAEALGLQNIEFRHMSLTDMGPEDGTFDYIIAHGAFSWIPEPVRLALLDVCRDHLSPQGIAYISYNVLPSWHKNLWMREMCQFASEGAQGRDKLTLGRELLDLACQSPGLDEHLKGWLRLGVGSMAGLPAGHLLHEYFEADNVPYYFRDFMALAEARGLQYLADAAINWLIQDNWPAARKLADRTKDLVRAEQLSDFLRHRMFRTSLLCHRSAALDRTGFLDRMLDMHVMSFLRRDPRAHGQSLRFASLDGSGGIELGPSPLAAALQELEAAFPHALPVRDLLRKHGSPDAANPLAGQFRDLWGQGYLDLLAAPLPLPPSRPDPCRISPLARQQARQEIQLTNLYHGSLSIEDSFRQLIPFIDGTRRDEELAAMALEMGIVAADPRLAPAERRKIALSQVQRFLDWCLQFALILP